MISALGIKKGGTTLTGLHRLTLYGLLLVDTVSHRISAEAHAGDLHDGRDHLALSIDKLRRVLAVLDEVLPVIVHSAPDLSEGYLAGDIGKGDHKDDGLPLSLMVLQTLQCVQHRDVFLSTRLIFHGRSSPG